MHQSGRAATLLAFSAGTAGAGLVAALLTYVRADSFTMSKTATAAALKLIRAGFGAGYAYQSGNRSADARSDP